MPNKTYTYYRNKAGLYFVPIVFIGFGLFLQYFMSQEKNNLSDPFLLNLHLLFYTVGFLSIIWVIAWLKAPPILTFDMDQVTLKPNLFTEAITLRWMSLSKIRYTIHVRRGKHGTTRTKYLEFESTDGSYERINLDFIEPSFNELHDIITEIAPHIKWIYPD